MGCLSWGASAALQTRIAHQTRLDEAKVWQALGFTWELL